MQSISQASSGKKPCMWSSRTYRRLSDADAIAARMARKEQQSRSTEHEPHVATDLSLNKDKRGVAKLRRLPV